MPLEADTVIPPKYNQIVPLLVDYDAKNASNPPYLYTHPHGRYIRLGRTTPPLVLPLPSECVY